MAQRDRNHTIIAPYRKSVSDRLIVLFGVLGTPADQNSGHRQWFFAKQHQTERREIPMKYLSYEEFEKTNVFGKGSFNEAFAQYFVGNSFLNPLTDPNKTAVFLPM